MLTGGIRLGRFFNVSLYLNPWWFLILFLNVIPLLIPGEDFNPTAAGLNLIIIIGIYVSVVIHEYAHVFAARHYGIGTRRITIHIFGGAAQLEGIPFGLRECAISIAGPICSAVLAIPLLLIARTFTPLVDSNVLFKLLDIVYIIGVINVILCIFNVLPIFPMDGGRVLRGLLFYFTKRIRLSTTIAVVVAAITIPVTFHFLLPLNIWSVMIMLLLVLMALTELSFILVRYNDDGSLKELKQ